MSSHRYKNATAQKVPLPKKSLLAEGHAISALLLGRVGLVGTHQDAVQRTVVGLVAVMGTLGNGAFDALIGIAVHNTLPPSFDFEGSMHTIRQAKSMKIMEDHA